jgi:anti-sigma B factor antagonist
MTPAKAILGVRPVDGHINIIDIQGEITANAEYVLTEAFNQAAANGKARSIILNFSGLDYMNSSGIGLLVTLLVRANRQKQKLLACGLSEHYQQIFELTRLNEAIGIYNTEAEALAVA